MTCIAGIEADGKVWIGGDSAGSDGHLIHVRADEKVWANKQLVFGFCGSFRMGNLLRYKLEPALERYEVEPDAEAEFRYMATAFIDGVRKVLKDGGFMQAVNGADSGGTFLVAWRGKLYQVYSDFQVGRTAQGFCAIGSGGACAEGVLYALRDTKMSPEEKITAALGAAEALVTTVQGPFKVVSA